jgi:heat shock protein HslJ
MRRCGRLRGVNAIAGLLLTAMLTTACGTWASADPLDGRAFLSTGVTQDGEPLALVDGTRIRLSFADGGLSANAGCNSIGGTYRVDGDVLDVEGGTMTEIGCDPALHDQDAWLSQFLAGEPTFALNGNDLVLTSGGTIIELLDTEVAQPDLALAGTLWTVDSIISGETVASTPAGASATFRFNADGTVEVDAGCNSGSGRYEADDDSLTLMDVALTEMACGPPAGDLEAAVLPFLGGVELTYTIDESLLTVMAGDNGLGLIGN